MTLAHNTSALDAPARWDPANFSHNIYTVTHNLRRELPLQKHNTIHIWKHAQNHTSTFSNVGVSPRVKSNMVSLYNYAINTVSLSLKRVNTKWGNTLASTSYASQLLNLGPHNSLTCWTVPHHPFLILDDLFDYLSRSFDGRVRLSTCCPTTHKYQCYRILVWRYVMLLQQRLLLHNSLTKLTVPSLYDRICDLSK